MEREQIEAPNSRARTRSSSRSEFIALRTSSIDEQRVGEDDTVDLELQNESKRICI